MDYGQQPRRKTLFDESFVDDELRLVVNQFSRLPIVDLVLQRLEIPLHFIHADT